MARQLGLRVEGEDDEDEETTTMEEESRQEEGSMLSDVLASEPVRFRRDCYGKNMI